MAKNPHTSFRLTGECRELLALLARLDGLNMTKEIEKLVREQVDRIGGARAGRGLSGGKMMGMILESTKEMGEYSVEVRRESFYLRGMDGSRHHITVYPHTDRPVSAGTVEILTEDIPKLRACLDAIEDYLEGK